MSNNQNQGASIEAERAEFEAACPGLNPLLNARTGRYCSDIVQYHWQGWQAARRTPSAPAGAGELPPLPSVKTWQERMGEYYNADGSKLMRGTGHFKDAEIADLRAQLAAKGQGEPVLVQARGGGTPVWFDIGVSDADEYRADGYEVRALYLSAPASAQPADLTPPADLWMHEDMDRDAMEAALNSPRKELKDAHRKAVEDLIYWKRRALTAEAGAQPSQRGSDAPNGWAIERDGDTIRVSKRSEGFAALRREADDPRETVLFRYFEQIAAPLALQAQEADQPEPSPMYFEALKIVKDSQRASVSLVQRKLRISWNQARDMIELMLSRHDVPIEWAPSVYQLSVRQASAQNSAAGEADAKG